MRVWALIAGILLCVLVATQGHTADRYAPGPDLLTPTGKRITPTAARGAIFLTLSPGLKAVPGLHVNGAAAIAASPDGSLLAILTSGDNRHFSETGTLPDLSTEYVFVFDIKGPTPRQIQVLRPPNTFLGLAWGSGSDTLYVSGGKDDLVREYRRGENGFAETRIFALGHHDTNGKSVSAGGPAPMAAKLAISPDGARLLVSNVFNDSVSLIDLQRGRVVSECDLRPGKIDPKHTGEPGGTYPNSVVWVSSQNAYIAAERDREVISLKVEADVLYVTGRISVQGQPVAMTANRTGTRLFVALDNADKVAILDALNGSLIEEAPILAPEPLNINLHKLGGANPNALALTPDARTLLVSNGGQNSVAVVQLSDRAVGTAVDSTADDDNTPPRPSRSAVIGLIPTGWYPTGVATAKNGSDWYIINGKSPTGPNAGWCKAPAEGQCYGVPTPDYPWATEAPDGKRYVFAPNGNAFEATQGMTAIQLERAGFLTIPMPRSAELVRLIRQVAKNNSFDDSRKTAADHRLSSFLHRHIHHVIYIVKENRSYDQILGDLEHGNGDPRLALFPERTTPNHHALARNFVTLDNFLVSGEGSWTGWQWSTAGRTSVYAERNDIVNLAGRGSEAASAGPNRGLNMALATQAQRREEDPQAPDDPDVLPGVRDVAELDGPNADPGTGYIWDAALRAGLTVRNYGFCSVDCCNFPSPVLRDPHAAGRKVTSAHVAALVPRTDPYYYVWNKTPDYWHAQEWKREFGEFTKSGNSPNLMLVQLSGDHFGGFATAIDGGEHARDPDGRQ